MASETSNLLQSPGYGSATSGESVESNAWYHLMYHHIRQGSADSDSSHSPSATRADADAAVLLGEPDASVIETREISAWEFPGYGEEMGISFAEPVTNSGSVPDDGHGSPTSINGSLAGAGGVGIAAYQTRTAHGQRNENSGIKVEPVSNKPHTKLGQLLSTAICGNDITASCLYCAGFCALSAGVWAPVSLGLVAALLYLFRSVYGEVGTALPLNGGTYTCLLNTTSKAVASVAGALSFLSYAATSVVSAASAIEYGQNVWGDCNGTLWTIVLLAAFCILNLLGITESAVVAAIIFVVHMIVMLTLFGFGGYAFFRDLDQLQENWHASNAVPGNKNFGLAILIGFGSAMLGITGFETSANFIEEQKPGVFPKTLRNMWIAVTLFNPFLSLFASGVLSNQEIYDHSNDLLAQLGLKSAGSWLHFAVSLDAFLVLSGSVLTGFVGVVGLLARLSLDRCLPNVLLSKNRFTKTHHVIIIGFFATCVSLIFLVGGIENLDILEGVYTMAFLSVMALFAIGNMLMKYKRAKLPRAIRASWPTAVFALLGVLIALSVNVWQNPDWVYYFALYFFVTLLILFAMFQRVRLVKFFMYFSSLFLRFLRKRGCLKVRDGEDASELEMRWKKRVGRYMKKLTDQRIVFFTRQGRLPSLNKAVLYVRENEQSHHIIICHMYTGDENEVANKKQLDRIRRSISVLDECYPKLRIDLLFVKARFSPENVERLSRSLNIPKNFMFIACPSDKSLEEIRIADFGGVRMITH
eukprot:ANDGO_01434.mRNA.1 hypothetical protein DICPUDRAFT_55909